ncbi:MAG: heme ABC transporter permease [Rhodospirillales bacterium]|nr:MAG: heme ABC transporter permease [Rhodospirillales bacterium]
MAPYHHIMVHFPISLLGLCFFLILLRSISKNSLAHRLESAVLIPCIVIGLAGAIAAFSTGLIIWPAEGTLTSTMGRNKILMASWTIAVWSVVLVLRWRVGAAIWDGLGRYIMLGLGAFGSILLATTGTLGGHLLGSPSRFSGLLHQFGWSVYQTYFVPSWVLIGMVTVGVASITIGLLAKTKISPSVEVFAEKALAE